MRKPIKFPQGFLLFIFIFFITTAFTQTNGKSIIDTGTIDGAHYRIDIPANWNKNLVMYAHGYNPSGFPGLFIGGAYDSANIAVYVAQGFAYARSEYSVPKGWALPEGVHDTEALREYFVKKYGKPDSAFITGHSMGGAITIESIEKYPQYYNGAMPMCPLSTGAFNQIRQAFDLVVVFNAMYPNILPSVAEMISGKASLIFPQTIISKIGSDTNNLVRLARMNEYRTSDMPMILLFTQVLMKDVSKATGGNPFDNTNTVYAGYGMDLELNEKAERLAASPEAEKKLNQYNPTGKLTRPTVLVHTIYDELINPSMGVVYFDNQVQKAGNANNLAVFYTSGEGHCNFKRSETRTAFAALRQWASSGQKPKPGRIQ
ncbi:MAG: alpha/beta hydrolase [Bacteroidetes bacterium]|nr:MAG: alpha/beta hydrolase [Bacteroidota bacterium]